MLNNSICGVVLGRVALLIWLCGFSSGVWAAATLSKTLLNARGEDSAIVNVPSFGRYAVTVQSKQGVALRWVDRMSGATPLQGQAGKQDGRLEAFLDHGEYKVQSFAAKDGFGEPAQLKLHPFTELHTSIPKLLEHKLLHTSLHDFQQRSYWIQVEKEQVLTLEVAARFLGDMRLWKDGTWLVEGEPIFSTSQASIGRPLRVAQLAVKVQPGFYLLTVYGGISKYPWTEQSEQAPLYLRLGIPSLAEVGRQRFVMSEFGTARFLVPAQSNYFRLELPSAAEASLRSSEYQAERPFVGVLPEKSAEPLVTPEASETAEPAEMAETAAEEEGADHRAETEAENPEAESEPSTNTATPEAPAQDQGVLASIEKNTVPPVAQLDHHVTQGWHLLTITAKAGQPFILQQFNESEQSILKGDGDYWVSTVHAGDAADILGASGLLVHHPRVGGPRLADDRAINVQDGVAFKRRFNLMAETSMFVRITTAGKYRVQTHELKSKIRIEPFMFNKPKNYRVPEWQHNNAVFDLLPGLYVLQLLPEQKGIVSLSIAADGKTMGVMPLQSANITFPKVSIHSDKDGYWQLLLNRQSGVKSGMVVRQLPIDLSQAFPLSLAAGETVTLPIKTEQEGVLAAIAEDGEPVQLIVDQQPPQPSVKLVAGEHSVSIPAPQKLRQFSLQLTPNALLDNTPLPVLATQPALPILPMLNAEQTQFLDFNKQGQASFNLQVPSAGLYVIESTGLLAMQGQVRTRVQTSLLQQQSNGVGRNFMIQSYLRPGLYQLTSKTLGESAGHAGIQLKRTELVDGGWLQNEIPARAMLPQGQALSYQFKVDKREQYRLQVLSHGGVFNIRLEDQDGWPVTTPDTPGDWQGELAPGHYRVVVLPKTVSARVVTMLQKQRELPSFSGHGPHRILLNQRITHQWREPDGDAVREADKWKFTVPADSKVEITLNEGMTGYLFHTPDGTQVSKISEWLPFNGVLTAGTYRLEIKHSRKNNYQNYQLSLQAASLLSGYQREVSAPASIPVSVGKDGLVELYSLGRLDVSARLFDQNNKLIAQHDDAENDWNFKLATRLSPGQYRLQIDPVGVDKAETTVYMRIPREVNEKTVLRGQDIVVRDRYVHVYPLSVQTEDSLIAIAAKAQHQIGLALEGKTEQGWVTIGTQAASDAKLLASIQAGQFSAYQVRVWSADQRVGDVTLRASAMKWRAESESAWLSSRFTGQQESITGLYIGLVQLKRPGSFQFRALPEQFNCSTHPSRAAAICEHDILSASAERVLLVSEHAQANLAAQRLILQDQVSLQAQANQVAAIDLPDSQQLLLITAQATAAQPAVSVKDDNLQIGLADKSAAILSLPPHQNVQLWNLEQHDMSLDAHLRLFAFSPAKPQILQQGIHDDLLPARATHHWQLPNTPRSLRLVLPAGFAAVLLKQNQVIANYWMGEQAGDELLALDADSVWIFNTNDAGASYSIALLPDASVTPTLKPGELLERNYPLAGRERINVSLPAAGGSYQLHVRGVTQSWFMPRHGKLQRGTDLTIQDSGTLWLNHPADIAVAWIDETTPHAHDIAEAVLVAAPQSLSLSGHEQKLRFNLNEPSMLHLQTPVTQLKDGVGEAVMLGASDARLFGFSLNRAGDIGLGIRASSDKIDSVLYDAQGKVVSSGLVQMLKLDAGRYYWAIQTQAHSNPVEFRPVIIGLNPPSTLPPADVVRLYLTGDQTQAWIYQPSQALSSPPPVEQEEAIIENPENTENTEQANPEQ